MNNLSSQVVPSTSTTFQNPPKVREIARILVNDWLLLQHWSMFCDELESKAEDVRRWTIGINNGNLGHYVVFREMLTSWISRSKGQMRVSHLCKVVEKIECKNLAEKLQDEYGDAIIENGISWGESSEEEEKETKRQEEKIPNFKGRKRELTRLSQFIQKPGKLQKKPKKLMLIYGLGGIGKTELCRQFLHSMDEKRNWSRIWLEGSTLDSLTKSIRSLSNRLGVKFDPTQKVCQMFEIILDIILQKKFLKTILQTNFLKTILQKSPKVLAVLDNVDCLYDEAMEMLRLPRKYENLYIIVTSRDKCILDKVGNNKFELESLTKTESMAILRAGLDVSDSEGDKLCEVLGNVPLAIQQAINYILIQRKSGNYTVSDYVKERRKEDMLELSQSAHDYKETTLVMWEMSCIIIGKEAEMVVNVMAYLDPDIWTWFLRYICVQMGLSEDGFETALDTLNKYSLVKVTSYDDLSYYSVHRLVQDVARMKVSKVDLDFPKRLFDLIVLRLDLAGTDHVRSVSKFAFNGVDFDYSDSDAELLRRLVVLQRGDCATAFIKRKGFYKMDLTGLGEEECLAVLEKLAVFWVCHEGRDVSEVNLRLLNSDWVLDSTFITRRYDLQPFLTLSEKHFYGSGVPYFVKVGMAHASLEGFRLNECYSLLLELLSPQFDHFHHLLYHYLWKLVRANGQLIDKPDRQNIKVPLAGLLANLLPSPQLSETTKNKIKLYLATLLESLHWVPAATALFREFEQSQEGRSALVKDIKNMTPGELTLLMPQKILHRFQNDNRLPEPEKLLQMEEGSSIVKMDLASIIESLVNMINGAMDYELGVHKSDYSFRDLIGNKIGCDFEGICKFGERPPGAHYPRKFSNKMSLNQKAQIEPLETHVQLRHKLDWFRLNKDWTMEHLEKQELAATLETSGDYINALELRQEIYTSCNNLFGQDDGVTKDKYEQVTILEGKISLKSNFGKKPFLGELTLKSKSKSFSDLLGFT